MTIALFLAAALLVILWLVLGRMYLAGSLRVRLLGEVLAGEERDRTTTPGGALPSLSIVVTARDEAAAIESTVRHALSQRYPGLEVIVVDDRSGDGTGAILDRLEAEARRSDPAGPRLTVIHVRGLPAGWIGKCHACHVGAGTATGRWLLFMDGDVSLASDDLLARVVAMAEGRNLDHVGVFPDLRPFGRMQAALMFAFEQAFMLAARAWEMDRDRPRGGAGVGAFNLVRREAYERIGGHLLIRMDVADDLKLGRLLKESGARQRLYSGLGLVRCPWHRGAWAVVRGLEKNLFAGVDYSIAAIVGQTLLGLVALAGPLLVGLLAGARGGPAWLFAPLVVETGILLAAAVLASRRLVTSPIVLWALYPAAMVALIFAVWNSMLTTLRRGGVRWRDTFYPLRELRLAAVRPGSGLRFDPRGRGAAAAAVACPPREPPAIMPPR